MYPVDQLNFAPPQQVETGTLLLQRVGSGPSLSLRTTVNDGGQDVPSLMYFTGDHGPFTLQPAPTSPGLWIAIGEQWELQVDPASSYSSVQNGPAVGDVFSWNGAIGFVGAIGYGHRYITREGATLDEMEWASYTGFRRWRILHWPDRGTEPVVLFEREP